MEPIELTEKIATESAKELRGAYDALHERAYKFATVIAAAAGALAAYAVGRIGSPDWTWQSFPTGALSLWLFGIAAYALVWGASTKNMLAGATGASVMKLLRERMPAEAIENATEEEARELSRSAVEATRWDLAGAIDKQIEAYAKGVEERGSALDRAYRLAIFGSPISIGAGLLIAWLLRSPS